MRLELNMLGNMIILLFCSFQKHVKVNCLKIPMLNYIFITSDQYSEQTFCLINTFPVIMSSLITYI